LATESKWSGIRSVSGTFSEYCDSTNETSWTIPSESDETGPQKGVLVREVVHEERVADELTYLIANIHETPAPVPDRQTAYYATLSSPFPPRWRSVT
jgi:hypothetical protein